MGKMYYQWWAGIEGPRSLDCLQEIHYAQWWRQERGVLAEGKILNGSLDQRSQCRLFVQWLLTSGGTSKRKFSSAYSVRKCLRKPILTGSSSRSLALMFISLSDTNLQHIIHPYSFLLSYTCTMSPTFLTKMFSTANEINSFIGQNLIDIYIFSNQTYLSTYPPIENGIEVSRLSSTFNVVKLFKRPGIQQHITCHSIIDIKTFL